MERKSNNCHIAIIYYKKKNIVNNKKTIVLIRKFMFLFHTVYAEIQKRCESIFDIIYKKRLNEKTEN